jgi:hypothetical protein
LCLGIAAGNGLYILLVIIGWSALRQFTWLFTLIELCGALYLLWIGSHLVRSTPQPLSLKKQPAHPHMAQTDPARAWLRLLNPKNALFYLALMTALLGPDVTLATAIGERHLDGDGGAGVGLSRGVADRAARRAEEVKPLSLDYRAYGRWSADGIWRVGAVAITGKRLLRKWAAIGAAR